MKKLTKRTFLKCAALSGLVAFTTMSTNLVAAPQPEGNLPTPEQTLPTGKTVQYLFVQTLRTQFPQRVTSLLCMALALEHYFSLTDQSVLLDTVQQRNG